MKKPEITNGCISPGRTKPAAAAAVVVPAAAAAAVVPEAAAAVVGPAAAAAPVVPVAAAAAAVAAWAVVRPAEAVGCDDDDVPPEKPQLLSFAHGWRVRAAAGAAGAAGKPERKAAIDAYGRVLYGSSDEDE